MKITFETPKDVVLVKELKQSVNEITINEITDNPSRKEVRVFTKEMGVIVLWTGNDYDAIGQWTDTDVELRIKEII